MKKPLPPSLVLILFWCLSFGCSELAYAEKVMVALAANFQTTFKDIASQFEKETGHLLVISSGSSGKFFAQISHGAPFDVFLSADEDRPRRLVEEGLAVQGSRFTYAIGRLTLWSPKKAQSPVAGRGILQRHQFSYLAIANPKTAPYGKAALQVLKALGQWENLQSQIVRGENIGQAFQFVVSGNAEWGLVSLSQVLDRHMKGTGSRWDVPHELYHPIIQQAVLLTKGKDNPAAHAILAYLRTPAARATIERFGYDLEE